MSLGNERQQLRCHPIRHLGMGIVPGPLDNQTLRTELPGEPARFGCGILEIRIAATHHDERWHPILRHDCCGIRLG